MAFLRVLLATCVCAAALLAQLQPRQDRFDLKPTVAALRAHVVATADADRTVAGSAWLMQAFLATGSTMRSGPSRNELKLLAVWLRGVQAEDGRFAPGGVPCSRGDQVLAAMAVCELYTLSNYALLKPTWVRAANAAAAAFEAPDALPAEAQEAALLALLANGVEWASERDLAKRLRHPAQPVADACIVGPRRRDDAARHLARQLLGATEPADLTAALVWPPDLGADPLHAFLAVHALTPHRAQLARYLEPLNRLAAMRAAPAGDGVLWPAAAGFDAVVTSAMLTMVLSQAEAWLPDRDEDPPEPK